MSKTSESEPEKMGMKKKEPNQPTSRYGPCPECGDESSLIVWGWHGIYYDLQCKNGHDWTYTFPNKQEG